MTRLLCLLCCLAALLAGTAAHAQPPAPAATPITPAQARQALDVLNDPAKRAAMATTLETIIKAQPAANAAAPAPQTATPQPAAPASPTAALGLPLAPDSLGAAVLVEAASFLNSASAQLTEAFRAARGLPLLWNWAVTMVTDPLGRMLILDLAWRLAVVLGFAAASCYAATRALRRPLRIVMRRLARLRPPLFGREAHETGEARAEQGEIEPQLPHRLDLGRLVRRVPLVAGRVGLELVPVLAFLVVGHVVAGSALGGTALIRLVLLAVVDSICLCAVLLRLARALLAPRHRRLRLVPAPDAAALYLIRWARRLVVVGVVGYAAAEVGLLLGLSLPAHLVVLKLVALLEHLFLAVIVVQQRRLVRGWIRAPEGASGMWARVRNRFAAIWHWLALFYLISLWVVWAIAIPAGYQHLSRLLMAIVAVWLLARLTDAAMATGLHRLRTNTAALAGAYPGLDTRLTYYAPFLVGIIRLVIAALALVLFLQLMGLAAFEWVAANPLGERIIHSLVSLAITFMVALVVWELANLGIERHLARLTREAQIARIARLRTLLPILRAALLICVLTVAGLMVLSEIGVNTAPLLASAGIIGVAIGFGSQKLVQDLITGLFLLLENAMQVGDWVTVSGLSGTVEHLSVRTIRLRAGDGSVHIIPFSAVTSVTNTNRGLGNAPVTVTVAYHEDTDRVCEVLSAIATEMKAEPQFSAGMISDLQLWGVDRIDGAGATIAGQIVCTDAGRWGVQREFNRRVKKRFEALGIELLNPTRVMMVPVDAPVRPARDVGEAGEPRG